MVSQSPAGTQRNEPVQGRVVVMPGAHAAALVESGETSGPVAAGLEALRTKQARVAAVALGALDESEWTAMLRSRADVVLSTGAPATAVEEPETITVRNMTIDLARREVRAGGRPLPLTPTEYRILAQLACRPGQVVTHAEIFREVHGYEASELEAKNILKVHVWRLRSKLAEAAPGRSAIVNVRDFGYMLERRAGRDRRQHSGAAAT